MTKRTRHVWTPAEVDLLRARYADTRTEDLAAELGLTVSKVNGKARNIGLKKSEAYLASPAACRLRRGNNPGIPYRFKAGHVPANKGSRRPGYAPGRMAETQFKSRRPEESRNYRPIGSMRLSKDGYLERKVTDDRSIVPARRWVGVHRIVWEKAHGPIPEHHAVCFKAGQFTCQLDEITVDRLELVHRKDLMRRNSLYNYPKEIQDVIKLRGAVRRRINKLTKEAS